MLRQGAHVMQSNHQGWFWYLLLHKMKEVEAWHVGSVVVQGSALHLLSPGVTDRQGCFPSLELMRGDRE